LLLDFLKIVYGGAKKDVSFFLSGLLLTVGIKINVAQRYHFLKKEQIE